jgi:hypothetical protein
MVVGIVGSTGTLRPWSWWPAPIFLVEEAVDQV